MIATARYRIGWFRRRINGPTRGTAIRLLSRHGLRRYVAASRRFGA